MPPLLCIHNENKCSTVAEMGDRLVTIDMGCKVGGCAAFRGEPGPPSNTMSPAPRPTSLPKSTKWHLDPPSCLATTDMGGKMEAVPLWGWGAGSPSKTM